MSTPSILLIDDEEIMRDVISKLLKKEGFNVLTAANGTEGMEVLQEEAIDLVLLDLMLPGKSGAVLLPEILDLDPDIIVIMISAYASIENAVEATKKGAYDFVTKPFKNEELIHIIRNGLRRRSLELENRRLRETFEKRFAFQNLIGKSEAMQRTFDLISHVGPSRSTVLIEGESGTGKELVAKAIHNCSPRSDKPFVALNSGSIPADLLESELFGHVKGAFTGAVSTKKGLFEIADTGTVFLDEIGTLPMQTQAKLLRVIQEREFRRVGGLENIRVDVRIVAATNIDLREAVERGEFRDDLYYRLNVITIHLPPLRERKDDIPLLAEYFLNRFCEADGREPCTLDQNALKLLIEYDWPGNVRELENAIERAVVLVPEDGVITQAIFPRDILDSTSVSLSRLGLSANGASLKDLVLEFEKNLIITALKKAEWNQKKAASMLKVNPTTLNEKLKRLNISIP
ncbi:MAG: sigma-54-dependent Fis family transcriptional regulator [Acidobacteriota bacterium]|nr:MAG: sigma-54-dependent Fis family transcriptional regulator [Acidobacteriota bacterium]